MIIVMQRKATEQNIQKVIDTIREHGLAEHVSRGQEVTIIGALGNERIFNPEIFECLDGVDRAVQILQDWQIISRDASPEDMVLTIRKIRFGEGHITIRPIDDLSSPIPDGKRDAKCHFMDPYHVSNRPYEPVDRQRFSTISGLLHDKVEEIHNLGSTAMVRARDERQLEAILKAEADIVYVGGELMNNWAMNKELGRLNTPMVLCKDKHHTVDDWLMAAERVALEGNRQIILGETGTLSFNSKMSHRLDVESIAMATELSHLPVLANIRPLVSGRMKEKVLMDLAIAAGAKMTISKS